MSAALLTILLFALVFGVYGLTWYWIGWARGAGYAMDKLITTEAALAQIKAELEAIKSDLDDYMGIANREATRAQGLEEALKAANARQEVVVLEAGPAMSHLHRWTDAEVTEANDLVAPHGISVGATDYGRVLEFLKNDRAKKFVQAETSFTSGLVGYFAEQAIHSLTGSES